MRRFNCPCCAGSLENSSYMRPSAPSVFCGRTTFDHTMKPLLRNRPVMRRPVVRLWRQRRERFDFKHRLVNLDIAPQKIDALSAILGFSESLRQKTRFSLNLSGFGRNAERVEMNSVAKGHLNCVFYGV